MGRRRIFIGSARESKPLAEALAQDLADKGYEPRRWWTEFPPGSVTLDRITEITKAVDGAVFVCGRDDKTWYRGLSTDTPRDNIVLEFGMFVVALGRKRTVVVHEEGTRLPSDLDGISFVASSHDLRSTCHRVAAAFDKVFHDDVDAELGPSLIVSDPALLHHLLAEERPGEWFNRDLYIGTDGARSWINVVRERGYSPSHLNKKLREIMRTVVGKISNNCRCVVSLGPGDALTDLEILQQIRQKDRLIQYIPVDISDGLLQRAMRKLAGDVQVPIGILADFEDGLNFVTSQVHKFGSPPYLFTLLGNTIGDLDLPESRFLRQLGMKMTQEDWLLLEMSTITSKWTWSADRRTKHDSYGGAFRKFIANGLAARTHEPVEAISSAFNTRIEFEESFEAEPDGVCININDSKSCRRICCITRYRAEKLREWFEDELNFAVVHSDVAPLDDILSESVYLLRRKPRS